MADKKSSNSSSFSTENTMHHSVAYDDDNNPSMEPMTTVLQQFQNLNSAASPQSSQSEVDVINMSSPRETALDTTHFLRNLKLASIPQTGSNVADDKDNHPQKSAVEQDMKGAENLIDTISMLRHDGASFSLVDTPSSGDHLTQSNTLDEDDLHRSSGEGEATKESREKKKEKEQLKKEMNIVEKNTTIELYKYQIELAMPALESYNANTIICAPTGSGKTLTAAYVCKKKFRRAQARGETFKALFIVCIRNLINQQQLAIQQYLDTDIEEDTPSVGAIKDTVSLKNTIEEHDVVVLTAQILVNCLKMEQGDDQIRFDDFDLMILDECHHTTKDHCYNRIMGLYHETKQKPTHPRLPQIMGLTASLGIGDNEDDPVDHYILMCANLDCKSITHVRDPENYEELLDHNPKPKRNQIIGVPGRAKDDLFVNAVGQLMTNVYKVSPLSRKRPIPPPQGSQHYENWTVERRREAEESDVPESKPSIVAAHVLQCLNSALLYYEEVQAIDIVPWMETTMKKFLPPDLVGATEKEISRMVNDAWQTLRRVAKLEDLSDNTKLDKLVELLQSIYLDKPESKGILLLKQRFTVNAMTEFIKRCPDLEGLVFPDRLVGQGGDDMTMTDKAQEDTLNRFRKDIAESDVPLNLLVATDVAQEGLDMPKCNFVIRYNFVSNEIGAVQARGRARAPMSEIYLIINSGSVNEKRELQNIQREHLMMEALRDVDLIPEEEMQERIRRKQTQLWEKKQLDAKRKEARQPIDTAAVTIHCKMCKTLLLAAHDMRNKGSNYIAADPEFSERVITIMYNKAKDFRYDSHRGLAKCRACNAKLGPHIDYKMGTRASAIALNKDSVMFKVKDTSDYRQIKQWSKVPFEITKEEIGA